MATQVLAGAIVATATATFAASAPASTWTLAGDVAATASVTAAATANVTHALAGDVAAVGAVTAAGTRLWDLAGDIIGAGTITSEVSAIHALVGGIVAQAEVNAVVDVDGQGLLVRDVVQAAFSLLQGGCGCDLPEDTCLRDALMLEINACLQTIYARGDRLGYFNRQSETLSFTSGSNGKAFSKGIQGIHGAVRLSASNIPLREVTDRMTFERFTETFCGTAPSAPRAYHVVAAHESTGDNVSLTLLLAPTPDENLDVKADVIREAPRYLWADVQAGTALQLPHRYAESLLVPLVRDWATSHEWFTNKELLPQIQAQANTARAVLGLINPAKPKTPREAVAQAA